jgi:hypothetical protein
MTHRSAPFFASHPIFSKRRDLQFVREVGRTEHGKGGHVLLLHTIWNKLDINKLEKQWSNCH